MCSLQITKTTSFLLVIYSCSVGEKKIIKKNEEFEFTTILAVDWGMSLPRETPGAARLLLVGGLLAISL